MNGQDLQSLKELLDERFDNSHHRFTELREDTKGKNGLNLGGHASLETIAKMQLSQRKRREREELVIN